MSNPARHLLAVAVLAVVALGCPKTTPTPPPEDGGEADAGPSGPADAGLAYIIESAEVPETGSPTVTFRVTDGQGVPLDLVSEINARTLTPRFTLSQLLPSFDYSSYYVGNVSGRTYTGAGDAGVQQPALPTATQAIADPPSGAFPLDRLEDMGDGRYRYTFSEPNNRGDRTQTHTVGMWGRRTFGGQTFPASATLNFVPVGNSVQRDETVTDQACNTCHGILEAHDQRRGTQLCITCHTPQTIDPETGNPVDFKVMVHRIHRGQNLPSVRTGGRYFIVGFGSGTPLPASAVLDFSEGALPQDVRNCVVCHQGANADRWANNPSVEACTSCHDNVSFTDAALPTCTGATTHLPNTPCKHEGGLNVAATTCALCHPAAKIQSYHVIPEREALGSFGYEILEVTNTAPGQLPQVRFRVFNPTDNSNYDLKAAAADAGSTVPTPFAYTTTGDSRLAIDIAWPSQEYTNLGIDLRAALADGGSNAEPGAPIMIDALAGSTANGDGTFTVTSTIPVPAGVQGSGTAVLEGHPAIPDPRGPGRFLRVPVTNAVRYFGITDATPTPRRQVVSVENCNTCHFQLSAHGSNRNGTTEVCVTCHNPNATDLPFRPSYVAGQEEPIDFKVLIHGVHASQIRNNPFTIIGFRGSRNEFPLGFPNQVGNCRLCHVGETFTVPLQPFVLDTTVDSLGNNDPADNVRDPKMKAVCTSCHDSVQFTGTATRCTGPNAPNPCLHSAGAVGDTADCALCHGAGQVADVTRVHPIQ